MCSILMSIKPKYVDEILAGRKKYEYRKTKAKRKNVDKIIIYSTSPIMKIVAEVDIKEILEDDPERVWEKTKNESGITKKKYKQYYKNSSVAVAYKLGAIKVYKNPKKLNDMGIMYAPQSFIYLD